MVTKELHSASYSFCTALRNKANGVGQRGPFLYPLLSFFLFIRVVVVTFLCGRDDVLCGKIHCHVVIDFGKF